MIDHAGKQRGETTIDCPLRIFVGREREIGQLTQALNQASTPAVKAAMAKRLRDATEALLSCAGYREDNFNCRLCREFSRLRNQTAALVAKAAGLAR